MLRRAAVFRVCVVFAAFLALHCGIADATHSALKPYSYVTDNKYFHTHAFTRKVCSCRPVLVPSPSWWKNKTARPYKTFLSLDGGGLRGIIPTMVLIEVEQRIKEYILMHLDDFDLADPGPKRKKEDFNYNVINDFHIFIADYFDGISGVSAGSWLTAYLATKGGFGACEAILSKPSVVDRYGNIRPGTVDGLRVFFLEYGTRIYPPMIVPFTIKPRFWAVPSVQLKMLQGPLYTPVGLEWLLKQFLGEVKLSEVATSMLVVAFDLSRMSAIEFVADYIDVAGINPDIYTGVCISKSAATASDEPPVANGAVPDANGGKGKKIPQPKRASQRTAGGKQRTIAPRFEAIDKIYDLDYYVRDIVRASSAFPMVHPSYLVKPLNDITNSFDMIDGAMVGNNPTLPMLTWALTHDSIDLINQTAFLSLGTGFAEGSYEDISDGGILQWMFPIIGLVTGSTPEYIQALMDYVFYFVDTTMEGKPKKPRCPPNQLLRIQLVRDATTDDGALLSTITADRDGIRRMEEMATLLGAQYRENIEDFISFFMCNHTSGSPEPQPQPPQT